VPPLWKRFSAEFIDFVSLFVIKLFVTFIAVDSLDILDIEGFFKKHDKTLITMALGEDIDSDDLLDLSRDFIVLEFIHRIVVCAFEILCTFRGPRGSPGGATPGKLIMGLRVFKVEEIQMTGLPDRVRIKPADDLGIFWATLRSILKNMAVAFLFPVMFTFMFLPYNRTLYDVMTKSIVVEVDVNLLTEPHLNDENNNVNNNNRDNWRRRLFR